MTDTCDRRRPRPAGAEHHGGGAERDLLHEAASRGLRGGLFFADVPGHGGFLQPAVWLAPPVEGAGLRDDRYNMWAANRSRSRFPRRQSA